MRIFSLLVLLTSSFIACGGATAGEGNGAPTQDAGAGAAAAAAASDAGAASLVDGGRSSTPTTTTPTTPTPTANDAGPGGICPNGEPTPGTACGPGIGPVCVYATNDCVCQTTGPGNPGRWACSPRLPDGGVGCPLKDPSPGDSCLGYLGSHCELGLGTCVCPDDVVGPSWLCSDG